MCVFLLCVVLFVFVYVYLCVCAFVCVCVFVAVSIAVLDEVRTKQSLTSEFIPIVKCSLTQQKVV